MKRNNMLYNGLSVHLRETFCKDVSYSKRCFEAFYVADTALPGTTGHIKFTNSP